MMDDSLSDTQQEKKMSVEQLILREGSQTLLIKDAKEGCFTLDIFDDASFKNIGLDRNQAHMLMLYLQQHLGYVSISKDRLSDE